MNRGGMSEVVSGCEGRRECLFKPPHKLLPLPAMLRYWPFKAQGWKVGHLAVLDGFWLSLSIKEKR